MPLFQRVSEGLARKTTRRGLFSRGADVAFGTLAGAAAGTLARAGRAGAGPGTRCSFPNGLPCACEYCQSSGVCAKPCVILTQWYTNGCWVDQDVTCCDCNCSPVPGAFGWCGCGSDYHNNDNNCPNGNATG